MKRGYEMQKRVRVSRTYLATSLDEHGENDYRLSHATGYAYSVRVLKRRSRKSRKGRKSAARKSTTRKAVAK